jgi:ABC-2 type transport system permease protein
MKYLAMSIKSQVRIPVSSFFALVFPLMLMFVTMISTGNNEIGGGYHTIDKVFQITIGIGLLPISLITFPMILAENLEKQNYKRLEYFGLDVRKMMFADILSYLVLSLLTILANMGCAFFFYQLKIPSFGYLVMFILQALYCNGVFLMLGAILALLIKKVKVINPVGMLVMFACSILSGGFGPVDNHPEIMQAIGKLIPMKFVMNDFFGIWTEKEFFNQAFLSLNTIYAFVFALVLVAMFVWNKRRTS